MKMLIFFPRRLKTPSTGRVSSRRTMAENKKFETVKHSNLYFGKKKTRLHNTNFNVMRKCNIQAYLPLN